MSRTVLVRVFGSLALAFSLAGCATRQSIAEIKYNPGRYQDRTVAVEGTVTSSWGVPLVPFKMYKVDDGTGEMTVVANNGRTPSKGSHVRVKGRVSDLAMFGGQSVGLHLEQKDIDFKRR
jgi:DNA/RNA endonuclease YhcR with UshA esterase domain